MALGRKTGGRQKGTPNKTTALLKDAVIEAAVNAGDEEGLVGYLTAVARDNPSAFLTLLGKVLPMQVNATHEGSVTFVVDTGVPRAPDE